jgi:hypothetical protein
MVKVRKLEAIAKSGSVAVLRECMVISWCSRLDLAVSIVPIDSTSQGMDTGDGVLVVVSDSYGVVEKEEEASATRVADLNYEDSCIPSSEAVLPGAICVLQNGETKEA